MSSETVAALIIAGVAVLSAIGSVLLLSFRVGSMVGTMTAFMSSSDRDRERLRADLTRQTDRLSLHVEHHTISAPPTV